MNPVQPSGEPPLPVDGDSVASHADAEDETGTSAAAGEAGRIERARLLADKWKARAEDAYADAAARRESSSVIDAAFRAIERDVRSGGAVLAGALAFRLFMFMVPYVLVLVLVLGAASDLSKYSASKLAQSLGITGVIARSVSDAARLTGFSRLVSLVVASFALFLASRALLKVLRATHALVWDQVPKHRSTSRGALVLIAALALATALIGLIGYIRNHSGITGIIASVAFTAVPFLIWLFISTKLPHAPGSSWKDLWPGAVVFAIGIELLHLFTVYWVVDEVSTKQERYGILGVALALLLWAYLMGRIVILAAVVNQAVWAANHGDATTDTAVF